MNSFIDPIDDSEQDVAKFLDTTFQMSELLQTGLTPEQLSIIIELLSYGVNSEELAKLILNMRRENNEWVYHNPESNDSSLSSNNKGVCHFEDRNYLEGQRIPVKNSCIHCFCDRGRSKCYRQNCPPPPVGCRMVVNTDSCHSSSYNCSMNLTLWL
ncbi:hypothetical protein RDWZM_005935 [Blomia tropicalis]|uniref:VWFC domain-containing protein n=1 Tax=Blomia tropicalis TaxID=40697 RepID=A0A9Q0M7S0_BLOTA|nr:hypothetical protein RDWZM_005935 [Blomia tropicalis]